MVILNMLLCIWKLYQDAINNVFILSYLTANYSSYYNQNNNDNHCSLYFYSWRAAGVGVSQVIDGILFMGQTLLCTAPSATNWGLKTYH